MNVASEIRRGRRLKCALCGKRGATLGCQVSRCRSTFHPLCAYKNNLPLFANYSCACAKHKSAFEDALEVHPAPFANGTQRFVLTPQAFKAIMDSKGLDITSIEPQTGVSAEQIESLKHLNHDGKTFPPLFRDLEIISKKKTTSNKKATEVTIAKTAPLSNGTSKEPSYTKFDFRDYEHGHKSSESFLSREERNISNKDEKTELKYQQKRKRTDGIRAELGCRHKNIRGIPESFKQVPIKGTLINQKFINMDEYYFISKEISRRERGIAKLNPVILPGNNAAQGEQKPFQEKFVKRKGTLKTAAPNVHRSLNEPTTVAIHGSNGFADLIASEDIICQLFESALLPLLYKDLFVELGISPPKGLLFYGPPGTGKTLAARAFVSEISKYSPVPVTFYSRKGADCLGKYVGEAERTLRLLFEEAERRAPSVIFFDEIDALVPPRTTSSNKSYMYEHSQVYACVTSTLLALMDGLSPRGDVVVIAATNRPSAIDPALRRPGRFDREIKFELPDEEQRKEIIRSKTRGWGSSAPSNDLLSEIAIKTEGFAGADLESLCSEAVIAAAKRVIPDLIGTRRQETPPLQQKNICNHGKTFEKKTSMLMKNDQDRGSHIDIGVDTASKIECSVLSPENILVDSIDWKTALQRSPMPCSKRNSVDSLELDSFRMLPLHTYPILFPALKLCFQFFLHCSARLRLPRSLAEGANLFSGEVAHDYKKKDVYGELRNLLCSAGCFSYPRILTDSSFKAGASEQIASNIHKRRNAQLLIEKLQDILSVRSKVSKFLESKTRNSYIHRKLDQNISPQYCAFELPLKCSCANSISSYGCSRPYVGTQNVVQLSPEHIRPYFGLITRILIRGSNVSEQKALSSVFTKLLKDACVHTVVSMPSIAIEAAKNGLSIHLALSSLVLNVARDSSDENSRNPVLIFMPCIENWALEHSSDATSEYADIEQSKIIDQLNQHRHVVTTEAWKMSKAALLELANDRDVYVIATTSQKSDYLPENIVQWFSGDKSCSLLVDLDNIDVCDEFVENFREEVAQTFFEDIVEASTGVLSEIIRSKLDHVVEDEKKELIEHTIPVRSEINSVYASQKYFGMDSLTTRFNIHELETGRHTYAAIMRFLMELGRCLINDSRTWKIVVVDYNDKSMNKYFPNQYQNATSSSIQNSSKDSRQSQLTGNKFDYESAHHEKELSACPWKSLAALGSDAACGKFDCLNEFQDAVSAFFSKIESSFGYDGNSKSRGKNADPDAMHGWHEAKLQNLNDLEYAEGSRNTVNVKDILRLGNVLRDEIETVCHIAWEHLRLFDQRVVQSVASLRSLVRQHMHIHLQESTHQNQIQTLCDKDSIAFPTGIMNWNATEDFSRKQNEISAGPSGWASENKKSSWSNNVPWRICPKLGNINRNIYSKVSRELKMKEFALKNFILRTLEGFMHESPDSRQSRFTTLWFAAQEGLIAVSTCIAESIRKSLSSVHESDDMILQSHSINEIDHIQREVVQVYLQNFLRHTGVM